MIDNLGISLSTSSGTRECFSCGSSINHRTVIVKGEKTEITFHERCFRNFVILAKELAFNSDDR